MENPCEILESAPLRIKCLPNNILVFVIVCCNVAYVGLA